MIYSMTNLRIFLAELTFYTKFKFWYWTSEGCITMGCNKCLNHFKLKVRPMSLTLTHGV